MFDLVCTPLVSFPCYRLFILFMVCFAYGMPYTFTASFFILWHSFYSFTAKIVYFTARLVYFTAFGTKFCIRLYIFVLLFNHLNF